MWYIIINLPEASGNLILSTVAISHVQEILSNLLTKLLIAALASGILQHLFFNLICILLFSICRFFFFKYNSFCCCCFLVPNHFLCFVGKFHSCNVTYSTGSYYIPKGFCTMWHCIPSSHHLVVHGANVKRALVLTPFEMNLRDYRALMELVS